jgi:KaiC/GvpD/RAD55 family RecA-like ATPase
MERVPTGIDELDVKLSGGYPKGKAILVTGALGAGKTIFGIHFLYKACMDGRMCVDIATEESPEDILMQAKILGLDLRPYLDNACARDEDREHRDGDTTRLWVRDD